VVFALFSALASGSPRASATSPTSASRLDGAEDAGFAGTLLKGKIDESLILRHWDDILRVAGSLKMGWVTSSLLISRLQAKPARTH
jgi:TnpA family transposase